jgi:hypothetical protein
MWDAKQINRLGMRTVPLILDQFNGFVGHRAPLMSHALITTFASARPTEAID